MPNKNEKSNKRKKNYGGEIALAIGTGEIILGTAITVAAAVPVFTPVIPVGVALLVKGCCTTGVGINKINSKTGESRVSKFLHLHPTIPTTKLKTTDVKVAHNEESLFNDFLRLGGCVSTSADVKKINHSITDYSAKCNDLENWETQLSNQKRSLIRSSV